jgi:hypothetical protein
MTDLPLELAHSADWHHLLASFHGRHAAAVGKLDPPPDQGRLDVQLACDLGDGRNSAGADRPAVVCP